MHGEDMMPTTLKTQLLIYPWLSFQYSANSATRNWNHILIKFVWSLKNVSMKKREQEKKNRVTADI